MGDLLKCAKCSGSGYIPFVKPDGTTSQYAQLLCDDCGGYDHARDYADANMPDRQPDDFDFPCSALWRGFYNGEREQQEDPPAPIADTLNNRRWDSVQQLRGQVLFLNKKVIEKQVEKKRKRGEY